MVIGAPEAATAELKIKMTDAEAAHTALSRKIRKQLADAEASRAAAVREPDVLRRRLAKVRHRAVDAAAHFSPKSAIQNLIERPL